MMPTISDRPIESGTNSQCTIAVRANWPRDQSTVLNNSSICQGNLLEYEVISNCSKLFYSNRRDYFQCLFGKIFESFPLFISRVARYTPSSSRKIS